MHGLETNDVSSLSFYTADDKTVEIDYSRDSLITEFGKKILKDRYLLPGVEISAQQAFARAAIAFSDDEKMAQRIYDYASRLWFMFATPVLSNGGTKRGLPISCFLGTVEDSREGIVGHYGEMAWLSSIGGGTAGNWSQVRSNGQATKYGSKSSGIIPFIHAQDGMTLAFSQGMTRRGSYAAYLDISHPEIEEFILIRKSSGDVNRKALNLHNGVNITDAFMEIIERCLHDPNADDSWDLIDPNSKEVVRTVSAKALWQSILEIRLATGEPYIHFIDASNRALPQALRDKGLRVRQSNLCTEIVLPTEPDRTAVCCLSSVNLETWDQWKTHGKFIPDLIRFLDNVLSYFIENAPSSLANAVKSATSERSLGLGAMGFHSYLQKNGIPFESPMAKSVNLLMFRLMKEQAETTTRQLAKERGEPSDLVGSGVRNAHLMAIAPNASSSILCGNTSPSVEPFRANVYMQKTLSGSGMNKNPHLEKVLEAHHQNNDGTWASILEHSGSVQHLDFLTPREKEVFKTAIEIDQNWIVEHAADRQDFICQSQSINLFFPGDPYLSELFKPHFFAWKAGLKSLYYCRSESVQRTEITSRPVPTVAEIASMSEDTCLACEG